MHFYPAYTFCIGVCARTTSAGSRAPASIGEKKFWNRIGAAWEHEDGEGLTLQLDLIPVAGGRIVIRVPKQEEEGA